MQFYFGSSGSYIDLLADWTQPNRNQSLQFHTISIVIFGTCFVWLTFRSHFDGALCVNNYLVVCAVGVRAVWHRLIKSRKPLNYLPVCSNSCAFRHVPECQSSALRTRTENDSSIYLHRVRCQLMAASDSMRICRGAHQTSEGTWQVFQQQSSLCIPMCSTFSGRIQWNHRLAFTKCKIDSHSMYENIIIDIWRDIVPLSASLH